MFKNSKIILWHVLYKLCSVCQIKTKKFVSPKININVAKMKEKISSRQWLVLAVSCQAKSNFQNVLCKKEAQLCKENQPFNCEK